MVARSVTFALAVAASGPATGVLAVVEDCVRAALRLGAAGGAVLSAVGIVALTVATRHRRALAVAGGAALGALTALALSGALRMHLGVGPLVSVSAGAIAGAAACGWFPAAFPFGVGALPGALLGAFFPLAGRAALGAAVGALGMGFVALLNARAAASAFASFAGGLLLGTGILATFGAHPLAREVAARPFALVAFAVVAGVAGTALQSARGDGPPAVAGPDQPTEQA